MTLSLATCLKKLYLSNLAASSVESTFSSIVRPLRTLKDDLQNIVRDKKMSLVRAAALEQDKEREASESALGISAPPKRHVFSVVFAAILLATLGSAALLGVALIMKQREGGVASPAGTPLLFAEVALPLP